MTETAFPVIDSHVHLFLSTPVMNPEKWPGRLTAEQADLMRQRFEQNMRERDSRKSTHQ